MQRAVLVTGGGRGIGLAIARAAVRSGHNVAVTYRNTPPPPDITGIACDVTDPNSAERAVKEFEELFGPVEVLVSNAGITNDKLVMRMTDEDFDAVLDTNLTAAFRMARLVSRNMMKVRWGRLIFVSSVIGYFGAPGQSNYAASKAGLTGLARALAWEMGRRNVTVNVVAPGLIETEMTRDLTAERRELLLSITPLQRMGQPDEVAHVVDFLTSDRAGFISGAVVPVSGGLAMGH